jgi:hypothetical protein
MRVLATIAIISLTGSAIGAQTPSLEQQQKADAERAMLERKAVLGAMTVNGQTNTFITVARERVPLEKTVKGAPYSAEILVESNQTLADGNRINQKTTGRVYRDGEGRIRREEDRADGLVSVSIVDPVAGVSYSLDPENHIAWKTPAETSADIMKKLEARRKEELMKKEEVMKEEERRRGSADAPSRADAELEAKRKAEVEMVGRGRGGGAEERKVGPLERKSLEGVAVEGHRATTVIRAGAIGNDLPITITAEEWSSPELQVLVMTRRNDPRQGESSYRLTNIIRAEPSPSLFQVPPDYTVKETGIRKFDDMRER